MKILLDPTPPEFTLLEVDGRISRFPHAKKDCGAALIRKLAAAKISQNDELAVIVGPGNFTAIRTACLVGNAVKFLTNCATFARKKDESRFRKVTNFAPFYAVAPSITIAKK